jgi:negative regulator of flagellin synthesis FlgM
MASKISPLDTQTVPVNAGSAVKRVPDAATGGKPEAAASTVEVHITQTARRLAAIEQTLKDQPEVDMQRVNTVRAAIEGGTYKVSADRVADRLVAFERTLAAGRRTEK